MGPPSVALVILRVCIVPPNSEQILHDEACLYFMNYYDELFAICMKAVNRDSERANELMSDVVLARLPRIIELWDGVKPIKHYVNTSIRWYVIKELTREKKLQKRYESGLSIDIPVKSQWHDNEELEDMLKVLQPFERQLV